MDASEPEPGPDADDLLIGAQAEIAIRLRLVAVALGEAPADAVLGVERLFGAGTGTRTDDAEIAIAGRRIAATGPAGQ